MNSFCVTVAGEGPADEAVLRRIVDQVGGNVAIAHACSGKTDVLRRLDGFNHAARISPWFVVVDLDGSAPCAPPARARWLPAPSPLMRFRIAVREAEAWLLAHRDAIASYLSVRLSLVPAQPELLPDPKLALVNLARASRRTAVREDMVPIPGGGRSVGPGYEGRIIDFARNHWDPVVASANADSLRRCLFRLDELRSS